MINKIAYLIVLTLTLTFCQKQIETRVELVDGIKHVINGHENRQAGRENMFQFVKLFEIGKNHRGLFNRPTELKVASNGKYYVLDAGDNSVKVFNNKGVFEYSFGSKGQGPGEFFRVNDLSIYNNTIYINDRGNQRLSLHDLNGRFLRSIKITQYHIHKILSVGVGGGYVLVIHGSSQFNNKGDMLIKYRVVEVDSKLNICTQLLSEVSISIMHSFMKNGRYLSIENPYYLVPRYVLCDSTAFFYSCFYDYLIEKHSISKGLQLKFSKSDGNIVISKADKFKYFKEIFDSEKESLF
ncbi:6-bladed beta-propeller [bacterium]|nr:6-bladed beta-propeller [bacterium]